MKILCFIPAKGHSKKLPNKNTKLLDGKPLIKWTIEIAQKVFKDDDIVVNTDSNEIHYIALKSGVNVKRRREEGKTIDDPLYEMLTTKSEYKSFEEYDAICVLQCTSPFLKSSQLNDCIKIFEKNNCNSLYTVGTDYKPNGAIVIVDKQMFLKYKKREVEPRYLYLMNEETSHDIDTIEDFEKAEKIVNEL